MSTQPLGIAAVLLASLALAGCHSSSASAKNRQAADQASTRASAQESQAGQAAKKAVQSRINELEFRMKALKTDARPSSDKARREIAADVKKVEEEISVLRAKLSATTK